MNVVLRLYKGVVTILAIWLAATTCVWLLCYYSLLGFSMGIVLATGAPAYLMTFGVYGFLFGFVAIFALAAHVGDTL